MERVQLIFRNLSEVSAEERETMGVLSLTDVNGERAINIICDQVTCKSAAHASWGVGDMPHFAARGAGGHAERLCQPGDP